MVEVAGDQVYCTFLSSEKTFDPAKIVTNLTSTDLNKPRSAWWGSPIDAELGWAQWCLEEEFALDEYDFDKDPIAWTLPKDAKVFRVTWGDVLNPPFGELYPFVDFYTDGIFHSHYFKLNFNKLAEAGIVAVELTDPSIGHRFHNPVESMFNYWDCQSIAVLDSSKIQFSII